MAEHVEIKNRKKFERIGKYYAFEGEDRWDSRTAADGIVKEMQFYYDLLKDDDDGPKYKNPFCRWYFDKDDEEDEEVKPYLKHGYPIEIGAYAPIKFTAKEAKTFTSRTIEFLLDELDIGKTMPDAFVSDEEKAAFVNSVSKEFFPMFKQLILRLSEARVIEMGIRWYSVKEVIEIVREKCPEWLEGVEL